MRSRRQKARRYKSARSNAASTKKIQLKKRVVAEKQNSRRRRAFAQLRDRIVGVIGKTDVDSEYLTGKHVFYDKKYTVRKAPATSDAKNV